ncbi:MAG TPA: sugar phosphate isomerase/epimerase [Opitutus sp.]|nr:sugar phosphate isomerase/epimerase [Opitutus sp.]
MKTRYARLLLTFIPLALFATARATNFKDHLGIQMWSLRETTKTEVPKAFDLVNQYGLTEIEAAGFGNLTQDQYIAAMKAHGLKAVGAHIGYEDLQKDVGKAIATAKALGAHYIICPWIPHPESGLTVEQARKVTANFNTWGHAIHEAGLQFGWHPHGFEFVKDDSGLSPFEVIVNGTSPDNLALEMDVFWVVHAGQDPVKLIQRYGHRWQLMHVKDLRKGAATGFHTGHAEATDNVAVGEGQINWPKLIHAAEKIGLEYYIIEDETPDALKNIPVSVEYLRSLKP